MCRLILVKLLGIKSHENLSSGSTVVAREQTHGPGDDDESIFGMFTCERI
jgi:hypothetical protein